MSEKRVVVTVPRRPEDHDGPYAELGPAGKPLHANDIPANAVRLLREGKDFATNSDIALLAILNEVKGHRAKVTDFAIMVWFPSGRYVQRKVNTAGEFSNCWPDTDFTFDADIRLRYGEQSQISAEFGLAPSEAKPT